MSEDVGGGDGDGEAMKEERNASSKGDESPGASPSTSSFASSVCADSSTAWATESLLWWRHPSNVSQGERRSYWKAER